MTAVRSVCRCCNVYTDGDRVDLWGYSWCELCWSGCAPPALRPIVIQEWP